MNDISVAGLELDLPAGLALSMHGETLILRLSRAQKRNAINSAMMRGIRFVANNLSDRVKALIIVGDGENFSAGLDLSELTEKDASEGVAHSREWHKAFNDLQYAPIPVIAVLHGAVLGAGLELASAAHIRVAEPSAYYGLPEGQRGIFLGGGGAMRLSRLIGVSRVTDLMMTGRTLDAQQGYQCGLSQYLTEARKGLETALGIAVRAGSNAPLSNYAIIHALPRIAEMGPDEGLFAEALMTGVVQSAPDAKARLRAFLEKKAAKVSPPGNGEL